jgi:isopenicillin-N epimerase
MGVQTCAPGGNPAHGFGEIQNGGWHPEQEPAGKGNCFWIFSSLYRPLLYNCPMPSLKEHFLLDPEIVFLNHGSYGATPRPVFVNYQNWQQRLERQPVLFLGREFDRLMQESRRALGAYLNADANDLVYIPNATHGANIIARSLNLQPDDEVLATDHEYGACDYTWEFICDKAGAKYIRQPIPLSVRSNEEIVERFLHGITPRTKAIYLSHLTSTTALCLPVEQVCRRAREMGLLSIIDAAHSPGQIPVDLGQLGADVVFGNCHKWMLSPKGAAFLYMRNEVQHLVEPFIVSWGYRSTPETTTGSRFLDLLQWTGTRDPAAALAVPTAIQFMRDHDWDEVRRQCHLLLRQALERICHLTGLSPAYPLDSDFYSQMGIAPLPPCNPAVLKSRLYDEYKIEVPVTQWQDKQFIRVSIQAYNSQEDVDALLRALTILLPETASQPP